MQKRVGPKSEAARIVFALRWTMTWMRNPSWPRLVEIVPLCLGLIFALACSDRYAPGSWPGETAAAAKYGVSGRSLEAEEEWSFVTD